MNAPELKPEEVGKIVPRADEIGAPLNGGQKQVFPCKIDGAPAVLKFMTIGDVPQPALSRGTPVVAEGGEEVDESASLSQAEAESDDNSEVDATTARAARELSIMQQANSPYLVKPGSIALSTVDHNGKRLLYFSEEFIEGKNLAETLAAGKTFSEHELLQLAEQLGEAVRVLWSFAKIHRDIKPANIMQRVSGDFVLLDLGLAFDLMDESLTQTGFVVGTPAYYSPEQLQFAMKRQLDFRSDLFSLGVVLYECATKQHPFTAGRDSNQLFINIMTANPRDISDFRKDLSPETCGLIVRLLSKQPHLRFRSCELLKKAIEDIRKKNESKS